MKSIFGCRSYSAFLHRFHFQIEPMGRWLNPFGR